MSEDADVDRLTLLPCPFCGSLSGLHEDRGIFPEGPGWRVECEGKCHAMTCYWHKTEDAVTNWNRRQSLSQEAVRDEAQSREAVIREIADRLANRTVPDLPGWREAISSDIAYIRSIIFE